MPPKTEPDPNYPRMMYRFTKEDWVIVNSEAEEQALGPEWSRAIPAPEPEPPLDEIPPRVPLAALRKARRERHGNR